MHGNSSSRRRRSTASTSTVALSLGLCLCAGQLMGPSPASAATPVASSVVTQAAAAVSVVPKLTDTISTKTITTGASVKVTAKLINPKTGKVVTKGSVRLQVWKSGAWRTLKTKAVSKNGRTDLWDWPKVATSYRTQFTGASGYRWAAGNTVRVNVKANSSARILAEAAKHTGALYKFAASGPTRFDCSGYTLYVYKKAVGKSLPHKANSQQKYGTAVSKGSKKVGDLIVFRNGSYGSHVGIYAGGGYMYDSPHTGARVGKHKIYGSNYVVRRLAA
ncbi:C40 family peptidase [Micromonosporaceae bacterium Da 78-11]